MDGLESFSHIAWVESNQWILSYFGAVDGFGLDFFDRALGVLLRKAWNG
jgi:hypothetical protein